MKAEATLMGGSLVVSIADADWHVTIRRVDGKTDNRFFGFHGKETSAADIAQFVPNWPQLQWTELPDSMISKSESYAKDREFRVNVRASEDSEKTHKEVVNEFLAVMSGG